MTRVKGFLLPMTLLLCVGAAVSPVSAQDKAFEENMKKFLASDAGQKALGDTVENYFRKRQQESMKEQEAQAKAELENQFKNPIKVDVGSSPAKGPANAKVTVVEFSDFQCPFCKRGHETMKELAKAYPNDVRVVFKNLPLQMHPQAMPAAKAALAAGKQGKFWEMQDALFDNQAKLNPDFYAAKAKDLGLNVDQFTKDMASPEIEKAVKADIEQANKLGLSGTPAYYVNGVSVRGAYPLEHFKMIVDRWLAKK